MSIKVTCEIKDYSNPAQPPILIHSNWCDKRMVEIEYCLGDGTTKRQTVCGQDLIEAVHNAMNTNYWG